MKKFLLFFCIITILFLTSCAHYDKNKLDTDVNNIKSELVNNKNINVTKIENVIDNGYMTNLYTGEFENNSKTYHFTYDKTEDLLFTELEFENSKKTLQNTIINEISITDYEIKNNSVKYISKIQYKDKDGKLIEKDYKIEGQLPTSSDSILEDENLKFDISIGYKDRLTIGGTNFSIDILKKYKGINSISLYNSNEQMIISPVDHIYVDGDEKNLIMSYEEIFEDFKDKNYGRKDGEYYKETYYKLNDYEIENVKLKYEDILEIIYDENYNIITDKSLNINPKNNFEVTLTDSQLVIKQKQNCPYYIYILDDKYKDKNVYISKTNKDGEDYKDMYSLIEEDEKLGISKDGQTTSLFIDYSNIFNFE